VRALKTDGNDLEASWSAALLEIFEGYYYTRMDWNKLKRRLGLQDSWLLMDGETVVGCAQLAGMRGFVDGAMMLTEFVYHWRYSGEKSIHQMLQAIVDVYQPTASCILMDVSRKYECNLDCYRRFGFQLSPLPSLTKKDNMILIKKLEGNGTQGNAL